MNWGYKILSFYLGFVALIVFMVYSAFQYNVNLVTSDYYERELDYQKIIDGSKNLSTSKKQVVTQLTSDQLSIQLPAANPAQIPLTDVELWLYNEAVRSGDIMVNHKEAFTSTFNLPLGEQHKGRYVLKVKWHQGDTPYYFEKPMVLE